VRRFLLVLIFAELLQAQGLSVSPQSLAFVYTLGGNLPAPRNVTVDSNGPLAFTVANPFGTPWIGATQSSETTPATIRVSVNPAGLSTGAYGTVLTVLMSGSIVPVPIKVQLTIFDSPKFILLPTALEFTYQPGQATPPSRVVYVTASGKPVAFTASRSNASWLDVTPVSGNTPANIMIVVHPEGLAPGSYTGAITFASADAPSAVLTVSLNVAPAPFFEAANVVNIASLRNGPIAPGELLRITGSAFGGPSDLVAQVNALGRLATKLGDTEVLFDGVPAPLLLVDPTALGVFAPYEIDGQSNTKMTVVYKGVSSAAVTLPVAPSAPGIFAIGPNGTGQAQALNQNSTINSQSNPAAPGTIITVYITGEGQTIPAGIDGLIARSTPPQLALAVTVSIGDRPAQVTYSGGAGALSAGVAVVAAIIPNDVTGPAVPIQVTIGSAKSQAGVTIAVK
jgi:uncharacterized protein (TIGR03437 family)